MTWVCILPEKSISFLQAPDDTANQSHSYGTMLNFQEVSALGRNYTDFHNRTMSQSLDYLMVHTPYSFQNLIRYNHPSEV